MDIQWINGSIYFQARSIMTQNGTQSVPREVNQLKLLKNRFFIFSFKLENSSLLQRMSKWHSLEIHRGCVNTISWDETGQYLLSGSDDHRLIITEPHSKKIYIGKKITQCLKMTENVAFLIFQFWHFPLIFVLLKMTCLVTLFDRKLQVFKNSPKLTIFGIFNELLSTQNVNVARFARNVE